MRRPHWSAAAIATVPEIRPVDVDADLYDPIVQALGIVTDSSRTTDAEAFATFVLGDDGQSILKQFGFKPAEARIAGASGKAASVLPEYADKKP